MLARVVVGDLGGAVRRPVVDDHDLNVGIRNRQQRVDAPAHVLVGDIARYYKGHDGRHFMPHYCAFHTLYEVASALSTVSVESATSSSSATRRKIILNIGKNIQKEIALLMIIVMTSAIVPPVEPKPQVSISRL